MKTLVTDGFENEIPDPNPKAIPLGDSYIVYGKDSYVDSLDEATINALLVTAVIKEVTTKRYPGGRTHIYVSMAGSLPDGIA